MKNSALFFKNVLRVLLLTLVLSFAYIPTAHAYTPDYFGVSAADLRGANLQENIDTLNALGMSHTYTWGGSNAYPSGTNNIQLVMIRLGSTWWQTQGFTPKSTTNTSCNGSFTVGVTYEYNRCNIETRVATLKSYINSQPNHYYIIGNEINNDHADGDGAVPAGVTNKQKFQAYQFKAIYDAIMTVDPGAKIVAPSVAGFDPGMNDGKTWYNSFVTEYQNLFGSLPINVLNHHAYDTFIYEKGTFNKATSLTSPYQRRADAQNVINELKNFRSWADGKGWSSLPIFITEFGTLNCEYTTGQPKYCWNIDDDPNNSNPDQTTNNAITTAYLNQLINGFKRYQNEFKIQKWFIFGQADQWRDYYAPAGNDTLVQNPTVLANYDGSGNYTSLTTVGTWYKNKSLEQTFADVPTSHPHYAKIEAEYNKGFIDHCGTPSDIGTMNFCPIDMTSRAVLARWLMKGKGYTEYKPVNNTFSDVLQSNFDYGWIEKIYSLGIVSGCQIPGQQPKYCPNDPVNREQAAKFITLTLPLVIEQQDTQLPEPFSDITDTSHWAFKFIKRIKRAGITNGQPNACPPWNNGTYCPQNTMVRADMAAFLFNAGL